MIFTFSNKSVRLSITVKSISNDFSLKAVSEKQGDKLRNHFTKKAENHSIFKNLTQSGHHKNTSPQKLLQIFMI